MEAHDVEAEPVDLVFSRIEHERVDHQFFHHAVLAGGVGAAGAFFEIAVCVKAMVVIRHHLIEIGVRTFAAGVGVVEDDVLNDAQPGVVKSLDHHAVFAHAVVGIDGVAAFGRHVVDGVIAPVVGGTRLAGGDGGLLLRAVRRILREIAGMIQVDLFSFTLAKWKEGRMCTALSPLVARARRCFMPLEF